ncbi:MAG: ComF family protein [Clostridia bacterium]|nr:ComF family protein [Clostridia bacterium]
MSLFSFLQKHLQKLHRRAYPVNYTCYNCQAEVFNGQIFCSDCKDLVPYNTLYCLKCGRKILQYGYCMDCRHTLPVFEKARSLFVYEGQAVQFIHAFKNGNPHFAQGFAKEALSIVRREFVDADFLTFVPMTKQAKDNRGYNQSELFARSMSEMSGISVEEIFEKKRDTPEQKNLTRSERQNNLKGVFHVKHRSICKDKTVLLLDDTLTTGATANELAKLLYGAKAKKVYLLTIASVVLQKTPPESSII